MIGTAYYNENDRKSAAWLRELIKEGHIAPGYVDERSISDVKPNELVQYRQCHFFAGIGGWSLALRLAGWPDDKRVWTGSCPCQPFSVAGMGLGEADARHLWPELGRLIAAGNPSVVFGEQVASKDGRLWLNGVRADLEAMAYEVGAADLCAAGIGAPHIRQRLYWVANSVSKQAFTANTRGLHAQSRSRGIVGGMGNADNQGPQGHWQLDRNSETGGAYEERYSANPGTWSCFDVIPCGDGKARRIESGTFPLAHGVSGRVGLLRGYGNAIVPQLAAEFIQAYQEAINQIESEPIG